jgi:fatty acyl-CoA reductase
MLCVIFFHYLPAYIIDFLLFITGNKPFLVNVQKRISHGLKVLQYYTSRKWDFKNDNFQSLYKELNDVDKKKFNFNFVEVQFKDFIRNYILGIRKYILKEKPEDLQKARNNLRR